MDIVTERFYNFIKKDKTRSFLAFSFYFLFIFIFIIGLELLPLILRIPFYFTFIAVSLLGYITYLVDSTEKSFEQKSIKIGKSIILELKKIIYELLLFIPVLVLDIRVTSLFMVGNPENQARIAASFEQAPIGCSISAIIIAPIMEELIFRLLPYKFIKNKLLYIIVSTVIFAAMHVIHDPDPFYYIWSYMLIPLYWGYRYHKTQDILVTISMHSFNNLLATLSMLL